VPEGVYAAWVGSSQNHAQCCALQAYSIFMMPALPSGSAAAGGRRAPSRAAPPPATARALRNPKG